MGHQLPHSLEHDSVWSFIRGADEDQLRTIEARTGYELHMATAAEQGAMVIQGALSRPLTINSDEELGKQHDLIASVVHDVVPEHWEVETLSFHAGTVVPTYERLEWMD